MGASKSAPVGQSLQQGYLDTTMARGVPIKTEVPRLDGRMGHEENLVESPLHLNMNPKYC